MIGIRSFSAINLVFFGISDVNPFVAYPELVNRPAR